MKSIFMRVLFCKIHCPSFICFCKPSAAHLYTPGPLKLENTHGLSSAVCATDASDHIARGTNEVKEENSEGKQEAEDVPRSCIRKAPLESGAPKKAEKKRVQWLDNFGKELVEIKEFESSETGDIDNEEYNRGCACIIL
ncbi:unnamed protein product [Ilex paraguariensis]|uniref:Uncharacterized protein n=1 Tax=Ilex paraguariensis TaxID=185542 RepID=A0ABC8V4E6_9AQUA